MNALSVVQTITPATPTQRLWRLLCSVRLALVLILLITTVSLAGAIIIQASDEVLRSPQSYNRWVEGLGFRFGLLTGLMDFLGLFRVFRTWWFNTLAAMLVINMTTCTINRFPAMWRTVRRPRVKVAPAFFERGRLRARFSSLSHSQQEATDVMVKTLRRRRFQVTILNESDGIRIYAERNRYTRFGTFLTHGGIILALAAAILGNMAGFSDNGLVIPNGSVRAVGHSTGLSVLNEGFVEEDYPDGRPKDYRSDLVIYKRGIEVKRGTVRVNEPVSYKGIRLHQSYFGNAAVIRVKDSAGDGVLFEDGVSLAYRNEMYGKARPVGSFTLFNGRMEVDVVGTAQDADDGFIQPWEVVILAFKTDDRTMLFTQKLSQREPVEIAGLEFTFVREKQFTGLSVVKNPGVGMLWLATSFIVLGIYTVLYFPNRRVWALCPQPGQPPSLSLAGTASRISHFDGEFQRMVSTLEEELGPATNDREDGKERSL